MAHPKSAFWVLSVREIQDCYKEVERFPTFDLAMDALAKTPGTWAAYWTLNLIQKGEHQVCYVED